MLIAANLSIWDPHTTLGVLAFVFSVLFGYSFFSTPSRKAAKGSQFTPNKQLCYKDRVFLSLLQEDRPLENELSCLPGIQEMKF